MMGNLNCCSKMPCFFLSVANSVSLPSTDGRVGLEGGYVGNVPFNFFGRTLRIKHVSIGNEVNDRTAPILFWG